jgi:hypothetical protein
MSGLTDGKAEGMNLFMVVVPFTTTIDCFTGVEVEGKETPKEKTEIQQCAVLLEGVDYFNFGVSKSWSGEYWEGVDDAVAGVLDAYLMQREISTSPDPLVM